MPRKSVHTAYRASRPICAQYPALLNREGPKRAANNSLAHAAQRWTRKARPFKRSADAALAQLVEQSLRKRWAGGSSPSCGTTITHRKTCDILVTPNTRHRKRFVFNAVRRFPASFVMMGSGVRVPSAAPVLPHPSDETWFINYGLRLLYRPKFVFLMFGQPGQALLRAEGKNQSRDVVADGHCRTGPEDKSRLNKDDVAPSNAAIVGRALQICGRRKRAVASPAET